MDTAYPVVAIALAAIAAFSRVGKLRRDAKIVHIVHEVVGVPLKYFPHLATCEFAGALGLVLGIWWPLPGVAAGIGLVAYFAGAIASHVRVGDVRGIGPAAFLLTISVVALVLRVLAHKTGTNPANLHLAPSTYVSVPCAGSHTTPPTAVSSAPIWRLAFAALKA